MLLDDVKFDHNVATKRHPVNSILSYCLICVEALVNLINLLITPTKPTGRSVSHNFLLDFYEIE